jgi:hypothetical protein
MKKNVGDLDAYFRIMLGLVGLSWSISKMSTSRYSNNSAVPIVTVASAMKIAEGIVRICPLMSLFGVSTTGDRINVAQRTVFKLNQEEDEREYFTL